MKNTIAFLILIASLFSCKNDQLTNSYIYFDEPQPKEVENIASFPNKYIGTFSRDYSHQLQVESNYVIQIEIQSCEATKKQLDSLPDLVFNNNVVSDKNTKKTFKTIVKNDTIQWETERMDTLFSFAPNEVAKIYKSSLILNKEENGNYLVSIIKFDFANNKYIQFGTKNDFLKINKELKIPYEANRDSTFVLLKPERSDFRKLLRMYGFEYEKIYYFK